MSGRRAQSVHRSVAGAPVALAESLAAASGTSLVATRAGGLVLRGIALGSSDAAWESKLVSAPPDSAIDAVLPLAARNAVVELLLDDLAAAPRPHGSLVARAARLLVLAPGSVLDVTGDADHRHVVAALRTAGALAWASRDGADEASVVVVRVEVAWQEAAVRRLHAYEGALADVRHGRDLTTRLAQARVLFAARLFFEVHEVLEPPWQSATGRERELLQGVIQAAVAWHHATSGNRSGALRLATSSRVKIDDAPHAWHGFPLAELHGAVARLVEQLADGASAVAPEPPWSRDARGR